MTSKQDTYFTRPPGPRIRLPGEPQPHSRSPRLGLTPPGLTPPGLTPPGLTQARPAGGEERRITQVRLDPARVRIWPGNARGYDRLAADNCRDLIDSIIAEGGQQVPAVVRRVAGDPAHDYEVIAGTRRHFAIAWLRAHSRPEMRFLALVAELDEEAAFRLADLENRARKDICDLERARNYAAALAAHYGGHQARMAERLGLSPGWLSKMLRLAALPEAVIAAFAAPEDLAVKPAYRLARALEDPCREHAIRTEAAALAEEQRAARAGGTGAIAAAQVHARLLGAGQERGQERGRPEKSRAQKPRALMIEGAPGRPAVSLERADRRGFTLRLHAGHGLSDDELIYRIRALLEVLEEHGRGLKR